MIHGGCRDGRSCKPLLMATLKREEKEKEKKKRKTAPTQPIRRSHVVPMAHKVFSTPLGDSITRNQRPVGFAILFLMVHSRFKRTGLSSDSQCCGFDSVLMLIQEVSSSKG